MLFARPGITQFRVLPEAHLPQHQRLSNTKQHDPVKRHTAQLRAGRPPDSNRNGVRLLHEQVESSKKHGQERPRSARYP
ncbi:hypothetical protein, partial [Burkholderia ambifaria]|uniref:hypothetical protein n=1 Tax=Burkholderia ambifaria TaxID=152480 RepID=UPI001E3698C9